MTDTHPTGMRPIADAEAALANIPFRARFHLGPKDLAYVRLRGGTVLREHAVGIIRDRLAPAELRNDGRQTPWRGHPVFVAQHATATCCRGCLARVHWIERGRTLSAEEQGHCVELIMRWLLRESRSSNYNAGSRS